MLSPEQRAAFAAKLDVETPVAEETSAPPASVQEEQKVEQAPTTAASGQREARRPVPYDRFHEVNSAKRAAEERAAKLEEELKALRAGSAGKAEPKSYLDELIEQEQAAQGKAPVQIDEGIVARLTELERAHASSVLDNLLLSAQRDYPDLPQDFLLAAIGQKLTVEDAVAMWDDMKQKVLKATGTQTPAAAAPKAPATPPLPSKMPPVGEPKPRTLEEAHLAFRRHLARQ